MSRDQYIVGLDVGTTKVFTIVGKRTDNSLEILTVGKSYSQGLRKGVIVDMDSTVNSIKSSVREAEEQSGIKIRDVYTGIAGSHISSFRSNGAVGIMNSVVNQKDIDRVMESAQAVYVPLDREMLHIIPTEYVVDGEAEIFNPVGMRGVRLEANVQIVTCSVNAMHNLLECCELAGLFVSEVVLEPIASSLAVLTKDEKDYGVILVDIGGGTTDIAIFKNNTFMDTSILGVGGNHITNDIAVGLRLPAVEAERVKKAYGTTVFSDEIDSEEISIMIADREEKKIPRSYITEIIRPRCEELMLLVRKEIERMSGYDLAPYGMVLTGGTSMLGGIETMAESILSLPVRIGMPDDKDMMDNVKNPIYSTSVGLLLYAEKNIYEENHRSGLSHHLNSLISLIKRILRKLELRYRVR